MGARRLGAWVGGAAVLCAGLFVVHRHMQRHPNVGDRPPGTAIHSVTVTFDYDFTKTPACSETVKSKCIQRFNVYDNTGGKKRLLFWVLPPNDAHDMVKGITATSPKLPFFLGDLVIAVTALTAERDESQPKDCQVTVTVSSAGAP
jgi:hypothetical protein